MNLWNSI